MPLIERYIFSRTLRVFLLTLGALLGTLWVTQFLAQLDVITSKGQAIWTLLIMTVLALPAVVQAVTPIAFLIGSMVTLNSMTSDSELPAISAAGGARKATHRPILALGLVVTLFLIASYHLLAPASLSGLRVLLTRIRADVISTLVRDGSFRTVDDGLTMHIRQKLPDGSFSDIFVSDERDPTQSLQFVAARGMLLERADRTFLVLQSGDVVRDNRGTGENSVVGFATYALDLSQIGGAVASARYSIRERSTPYLLRAGTDDAVLLKSPQGVASELHDRVTAPFYTLGFAAICLAFLGRPRSSRQSQAAAIAKVLFACFAFRLAGFAVVAATPAWPKLWPLMYVIPAAAIGFGLFAQRQDTATGRSPRSATRFGERLNALARQATRTWPSRASDAKPT